jgi:hypothetical protein
MTPGHTQMGTSKNGKNLPSKARKKNNSSCKKKNIHIMFPEKEGFTRD